MTDKEFIYDYLEKTYEPIIDGYGFLFRDKIINELYNPDYFKVNFKKVIGDWDSDEGLNSFDICVGWYEEKKENIVKDLLEYLDSCTFELGTSDWLVKNSAGHIIKLENVIAEFDGKYTKEFITHFYADWYSKKVCDYSEKIMNKWI